VRFTGLAGVGVSRPKLGRRWQTRWAGFDGVFKSVNMVSRGGIWAVTGLEAAVIVYCMCMIPSVSRALGKEILTPGERIWRRGRRW